MLGPVLSALLNLEGHSCELPIAGGSLHWTNPSRFPVISGVRKRVERQGWFWRMFPGSPTTGTKGYKKGDGPPKPEQVYKKQERRYQKPDQGHIRQNHPFTKPPVCLLSIILPAAHTASRDAQETYLLRPSCDMKALAEDLQLGINSSQPRSHHVMYIPLAAIARPHNTISSSKPFQNSTLNADETDKYQSCDANCRHMKAGTKGHFCPDVMCMSCCT